MSSRLFRALPRSLTAREMTQQGRLPGAIPDDLSLTNPRSNPNTYDKNNLFFKAKVLKVNVLEKMVERNRTKRTSRKLGCSERNMSLYLQEIRQ